MKGGGVSTMAASTTAKIEAPAPSVSVRVRIAAPALAGERRMFSQEVEKVDEHGVPVWPDYPRSAADRSGRWHLLARRLALAPPRRDAYLGV
ncbi:MAG: hypothetical protein DMF94_12890 [Acidobacteria bacterium]|nr:MAG: hypothetical protein DMF94_12890 [Acidobacteriota bacterium]